MSAELVSGLRTVASAFDPKETMDRLEAAIRARGMTVFCRVDHAAGARQADLTLRPTEVIMFGAAASGTPLMQAFQTMGIDLPLKALVWQSASGATWLSYNEPHWIACRHGDGSLVEPTTTKMASLLEVLSKAATEVTP